MVPPADRKLEFPEIPFMVTFALSDGRKWSTPVTATTFTNAIPQAVMALIRYGNYDAFEDETQVRSVFVERLPS